MYNALTDHWMKIPLKRVSAVTNMFLYTKIMPQLEKETKTNKSEKTEKDQVKESKN